MSVTRAELSYPPPPRPPWPPLPPSRLLVSGKGGAPPARAAGEDGQVRTTDPCLDSCLPQMTCSLPTSPQVRSLPWQAQASPFHHCPSENWGYSPSKAWKRSLCSTVRRGGAHRNSGGARSQRAERGAGEMQVREEWDKEETEGPTHSLIFPSLCPLPPDSMGSFRRRVPESQPPPHPAQPPGLSSTGLSEFHLWVSRTSLLSDFNLPKPKGWS